MFRYFLYLLPLLLKITLFITCCMIYFQRRWTRCYRTQRVLCYPEWRLYFLYVWTSRFTHSSGQGFSPCGSVSTSTVQDFTVERLLSEFFVFLEDLNSTSCQFLLCGDFNFHVDDNTKASRTIPRPFFCWSKTACQWPYPSSGTHIGSSHHSQNGYSNFSYNKFYQIFSLTIKRLCAS